MGAAVGAAGAEALGAKLSGDEEAKLSGDEGAAVDEASADGAPAEGVWKT